MATVLTAAEMQIVAESILDELEADDSKRYVMVYQCPDQHELVIELTAYEAYMIEREVFGEEIARENYWRLQD